MNIEQVYSGIRYCFNIYKEGENKKIKVSDTNGYFPSKEHLILIRDWINELLKWENLEEKIKECNDSVNKRMQEEEEEWEERKQNKKVYKVISGYVYFLQDDSQRIKIGKTKNLNQRIFHLGLCLPTKPILFHYLKTDDITKTEKELHDKYQQYRLNGEWFALPQEELARIKEIQKL